MVMADKPETDSNLNQSQQGQYPLLKSNGRKEYVWRKTEPTAVAEKIKEGKSATVMKLPEPPELENISMPPIKDFMTAEQRMGELHADEIYTETWEWLKERNCAHLINPVLLHEYAMATARWIQIEGVSSQFGFVNRHPTTGLPTQSPFVVEAQSYLKLSNSLWLQIYQIVQENCSESYKGSPHDDLLESLLSD